MRSRTVGTALGGAVLVLAPLLLLVTGNTAIVVSSDEGVDPRPLWLAVVPVAAGLLLARVVPPRLPSPSTVDDPALRRQARWLVAIAVAFPMVALVSGAQSLLYPLTKVVLFLGGTLLVLRLVPATCPPAVIPTRWRYLGPVPAILAWGALTFAVPTDLDPYRDYDRVYLWGAAILTFLTASDAVLPGPVRRVRRLPVVALPRGVGDHRRAHGGQLPRAAAPAGGSGLVKT